MNLLNLFKQPPGSLLSTYHYGNIYELSSEIEISLDSFKRPKALGFSPLKALGYCKYSNLL